MGVTNTNIIAYKLVANGTILDLYNDEDILVSDNITGLFDVGVLPSDFSRTIMVPGTKKNNAFFEHYYDISIVNPFLFATNVKVPAYLDMDGIYLANGYLQLNKVVVKEGLGVESYEVSLYGTVSSFARDINRTFLTELSALRVFNHTASFNNITSSWENNLFNGDIVYPLAEYGQKIQFTPDEPYFGVDDESGSLSVQDFKPAIRLKKVWDACFSEFGYTYTGSFMNNDWLNSTYMLCDNGLKYLQLSGSYYGTSSIDLETYGQIKMSPISSSVGTNVTMSVAGQDYPLNWYKIEYNPQNFIDQNLIYTLPSASVIQGNINLNFELQQTNGTASVGYPQFNLLMVSSSGVTYSTALTSINSYMQELYYYNIPFNKTEKFNLLTQYTIPYTQPGNYTFKLEYSGFQNTQFRVVLDPNNDPKSYLEVTKLKNAADGKIVDIPTQMPYGTAGIKLIDFIKGIQKKFNLVIYPDKTKQNQFVVETFNRWYREGEVKDFNKYINLKQPIEVIPANSLAVNKLNFGDTLDTDYVSLQFAKAANREYGKEYYIDTQNFFSQGEFEVKPIFASAPLLYISGTGNSGSAQFETPYQVYVFAETVSSETAFCLGQLNTNTTARLVARMYDSNGNQIVNYGTDVIVTVRMDFAPCYGGTTTQDLSVFIPYGANEGEFVFYETQWVDCGDTVCNPESYDLNTACIRGINGGTGTGTVKSNSPIQLC